MLLDTLIYKTGHKRIVECASDRLWGTGLSLGNPDRLDSSKWISQGILGQILEDIHTEFQQTDKLRHHHLLSSDNISHQPHALCLAAKPTNAPGRTELPSVCPYPDVSTNEPAVINGKNNDPIVVAEELPTSTVAKLNADRVDQTKDMEIT